MADQSTMVEPLIDEQELPSDEVGDFFTTEFKVLLLLYSDEEQKFWPKKLARMIKISDVTIEKNLRRMANAGWVSEERVGNAKTYEITETGKAYFKSQILRKLSDPQKLVEAIVKSSE
jgi:DNA-binding MarR family transcriptional regulator